jgi:tetratricopeptide (TPR) repeat protein
MEGSLRQAGSQLRLAVQLVDATTGAHLWAETYNRPFDSSDLFALQDDLVPRIVSTVADAYGVLPHSMSQAVRSKPFEHLSPDEALLRSLSYAERVTAEEHAEAKAGLERAVQQSPAHSDCWAMLSIMLADEYGHGFGATRETLEGALRSARRAVDANPSNHRAYQALAWALYLRKEVVASRHAGERALALNPMDACTAVYVGQTVAYSGDWDRGCALIARAIELNPRYFQARTWFAFQALAPLGRFEEAIEAWNRRLSGEADSSGRSRLLDRLWEAELRALQFTASNLESESTSSERPVSLHQLQSRLRGGELLIEYALGPSKSFAFAVSQYA